MNFGDWGRGRHRHSDCNMGNNLVNWQELNKTSDVRANYAKVLLFMCQ